MGRYPEAPYDFECLYEHSCPHLDGHSTTWAHWQIKEAGRLNGDYWRLSDRCRDEVDALHNTIGRLEQENAQLKAQLKTLHQRQFKANRTPRVPRNNKTQNDDTKTRARGAPKGHPFWNRRPPDHVDTVLDVAAPETCPHCQCGRLLPSNEIHEHLQEDIVLQPKTRVVNFKHKQSYCPRCRRHVYKDGPGELRNCEIGPVTKATAVYLRYGLRIPYRQVQKLFSTLFNMPFVPASALAFDRTATQKGLSLYEDLRAKIQQTDIAYADETYWRQDGQNSYVWYAGNKDLALFRISTRRTKENAQWLLGDNFQGSLCTDGYTGYFIVHPQYHQTCLAHFIRKARDILKEIENLPSKDRDHKSILFCQGLMKLLAHACTVASQRDNGQLIQKQAVGMIPHFYNGLNIITAGAKLKYDNAEDLRQSVLNPNAAYPRLFTFLKVPGLAPTNNHAEQTLRTPVIFRKVCFGTRSEEGSLSHSVLPSLLVTATRQGNHPLQFFETLFTQGTATAQAALYHDSS